MSRAKDERKRKESDGKDLRFVQKIGDELRT